MCLHPQRPWINLKEVFSTFYNKKKTGLFGMLRDLDMLPPGSFRIDDDD
jgi:hypothetical protein